MFIILQIFLHKSAHFGRPSLKDFKRRSNSVGAQNTVNLFKLFSTIHFNNLLGKTLGNWGIAPSWL